MNDVVELFVHMTKIEGKKGKKDLENIERMLNQSTIHHCVTELQHK